MSTAAPAPSQSKRQKAPVRSRRAIKEARSSGRARGWLAAIAVAGGALLAYMAAKAGPSFSYSLERAYGFKRADVRSLDISVSSIVTYGVIAIVLGLLACFLLRGVKTHARYVGMLAAVIAMGIGGYRIVKAMQISSDPLSIVQERVDKPVRLANSANARKARKLIEKVRGKAVEDIVRTMTRAIELDPQALLAYHHRAGAYGAMGNYDLALADLDTLLAAEPNFAPALFRRGLVYEDKKDFEQAHRDFARAVELDGDDNVYQRALRRAQAKVTR